MKRDEPQISPEQIVRENRGSTHRAAQIRRDTDEIKDFTVSPKDIDGSMIYYIENEIKPTIEQNSNRIPVPVLYGTPERWKSIQSDGYYRDERGKINNSLIMIRRTSFTKNRQIVRNLDPNFPKLYQFFYTNYSPKNRYDLFSVMNNSVPNQQMHRVVIPDYLTAEYECIIWCDSQNHLNDLVAQMSYAESCYWGIPEKFAFYTYISDFSNEAEMDFGEDRKLFSNFRMNVQCYLISPNIQKEINQISSKSFDPSKLVLEFDETYYPASSSIEFKTPGVSVRPRIATSPGLAAVGVNIVDQDGNIIAHIQDGGTYSVIVLSGFNEGDSTTIYSNSIIEE